MDKWYVWNMKHIFLYILFLCLVTNVSARQRVTLDSLVVADGELALSYHIDDLLDEKSIEALERGITSEVVHHIQVWKRQRFINPLVYEEHYVVKIYYDTWEKKYRIVTTDENRLTSHLETVMQKCAVVEHLDLVPVNDLERGETYYISIDITFQPISAESYNAISDIFTDDSEKPELQHKEKSGFMSVLVNLLGFGDKEYSLKTNNFKITDSGTIDLQ